MSVTPEDLTSGIKLDVAAGRRPPHRGQARRAGSRAFGGWLSPLRRVKALGRVLADSALRPRPRPLSLDLPEYTVTFSGPAEFEFALSSRTEFPVRKLATLMTRSAEDLQIMASNIRQVEKRFAEVLAESLHQPGLISDLWRNIEIKLFSQDHQWRDIAEALNHLSPAYDVYRRIALVKYLQYLGCRQDVLRNLYLTKLKAAGRASVVASAPDASTIPEPAMGAIRLPKTARGTETGVTAGAASSADPETQMASMRDTAIFQVEQIQLMGDTEGFAFLPRGETLELETKAGEAVEIALSDYRLKLYPGQRFRLTDEAGAVHILATGKSVIGRHQSADIVIGTENRTVSRKHLMIEPLSPTRMRLTDLSSHGTSIPQHFIERVG